ncbi:hypothetical protein ABNF97_11620 [Plantactinospora sp. B6F1]|uniref:hypothetical protein n=1 Tax=Plantactinospora sp. B6F1 TaxID=3158971 RepID=UPI0032D929AC
MAERWRWFLRGGGMRVELPRPTRADEHVPGHRQQWAGADDVPEVVETLRCDGAFVYVRPGERRAALAGNQRADRYPATPPIRRNRRRS